MRSIALVCMSAAGVVVSAACASAPSGPPEPVVSPTGIVYEIGIPPEDSRFSQTATLYLRQEQPERALEFALEGVAEDPGNPAHFFLAGSAHARLGQYAAADSMFDHAQEMYPAYELEIEPERESAWAVAFNEGIEAFNDGEVESALEAWNDAITIFALRPEAHRNLASVLANEGRYDEAIAVYQEALEGLERQPASRVLGAGEREQREENIAQLEADLIQLLLFERRYAEAEPLLRSQLERSPDDVALRSSLARTLDGLGRTEEATELYEGLLAEEGLASTQLFNLGVALFRSGGYGEAAEAFQRLTRIQPESRDAWFNFANALFAGEDWETLAGISGRVMEVDPLGENAALLGARARLESGDQEGALATVEESDAAPVHVEQLQLIPQGAASLVRGRIVGNTAEEGDPIRLRFVFYSTEGRLGTTTVTVEAPPEDGTDDLEVRFDQRAGWYRYELLEPEPEPSTDATDDDGDPGDDDDDEDGVDDDTGDPSPTPDAIPGAPADA